MRSVMKRICLSLAVIAVLIFTGCGQKKTKDPITVTLWHVYGGQTESPLNDLIDQFNETIGKEENIWVQVGSVTNTNTIHENVLASAFGDPGASELPDMFVSYPKTVLAMPDDTVLVDYCDYFTKEELDEFIPDGVNDRQLITKIVMPLARPSIIISSVLVVIYVWNEYIFSTVFLSGAEKNTLAVALYSLQATDYTRNWPLFSAAAILTTLPVLILFFLVQKYMVSGLSSGGVKG